MQALKSVSLHDIGGPLADDALMTLATYYLRKKDYREADHYFKSIREQCHKSEFIPASYVLGAHASLMSYQGAQYDGKQLEEAKKLATSAIRLYPDLPQRAKLEGDLKRIDAEASVREWTKVEFHLKRADTPLETAENKRSEKHAAAVYCETIIEKYPESPQAVKAREELIKLGPQFAAGKLTKPLFPKERPKPKEPEPPPYDEPEEPGRLHISDKDAKPISAAK